MPYVDLFSDDDSASIWYTTNTPSGSVSDFDASLPTVIMLHPVTFDSTWIVNHLDDPRFGLKYNIVAFDSRFSGRSRTRLSGKFDYWVQAADVAYACQSLHLPAAHIWAEETESTCVALRFASLFPDMCLSLTLVSVPPLQEPKENVTAVDDLLRLWGFADTLEDFEHAISEMLDYTVGQEDLKDEELDKIVAFWQTTYPPFRRTRLAGLFSSLVNRSPLPDRALARISLPVLLIHGDKNEQRPLKNAEELIKQLHNAQGPRLAVVRGYAGFLSISPSSCSIIIRFYTKFLNSLPSARSELKPPPTSIPCRMAAALKVLAELTGRAEIAERSAMSCMSFSLVTAEVRQRQMDTLRCFHRRECGAFSPLDSLGRPLRSFTSRHACDHWFSTDVGSDSYAQGTPRSATPVQSSQLSCPIVSIRPTPPSTAVNLEKRTMPPLMQDTKDKPTVRSGSRGSLTVGIPLTRFLSST